MAHRTVGHSLEAVSSATPNNLHHIYFFLGQPSDTGRAHTSSDDRDTASSSVTPSTAKTRDGSPDSTSTKNSATSTGGALDTSTVMNPHAALFTPTSSPAKASPASLKKAREQVYEQRQVEGKGLGLVATVPIRRGTRIICERPLLTIPDNLVHLAWKSYGKLKDWQKEEFDELHAYEPDGMGLENTSRMFLIDHEDNSMDEEDVDSLVAEHVRVMSIFAVNNFNLIPKGLAVYAAASRLNHSCVPNTHHGYNPNIYRFAVHAARDIAPGEEITINYMGQPANFMVRSQRVEHLRTNYGFTCTCASCSDRTPESDTRRDLLNSICWGLQEYDMGAPPAFPFIADGPSDAFKLAVNAVNFLNAEGLQTTTLMTAMRAASKYALAMQDWPAAYHYALREEDVEMTLLGTEVRDLKETGAAASCWTEHVMGVINGAVGDKRARDIFNKENGPPVALSEASSPAKKKKKKKTPKTPQRTFRKAELAGQRKEPEPAKDAMSNETTSLAAAEKDGKDFEKKAEASTWAKVVAGGRVNGESTAGVTSKKAGVTEWHA